MPISRKSVVRCVLAIAAISLPASLFAADIPAATAQTWETETLSNGLRVIYATMPNSPTTHVRVAYHVGSRDERTDRQGFAHMFEHMMFRGSAHVPPQEHGKLIGLVGGVSNAFTSFDKTVYWETLPASSTEMALWLEADRMSSFKVSPQIFYTERLVVGEEARMRANQPYGTMFEELLPVMYKKHPYQWAPIGNMQQLQAATAAELQQFFNRYYVPNNAILIVAGNIDVVKTKEQVHRFFGWIPGQGIHEGEQAHRTGDWQPIARDIPLEAPQTEARRAEVTMRVPLSRVLLAYHMPPDASEDIEPVELLLSILGDGRSSRLYKVLVTTDNPLCSTADSIADELEDGGFMGVLGTVLKGKDAAEVEKIIRQQLALARETPVSAEELEKVKQQSRLALAQRFETAEKVATELGDEMLVHGNLDRVSTARQRLEAIMPADLLRVAKKYFGDEACTTMIINPGVPTTRPALVPAASTPATATAPATAEIHFPADYPTKAPLAGSLPAATFEKGVENNLPLSSHEAGTVRAVVMEDHRMPIINWTLTLRAGYYSEPQGKEGLGGLTSAMIRRGPRGKTYDQFNEEMESRAISLEVTDMGDNIQITGSCLKEQFPYAIQAAHGMLANPAFDAAEFERLKNQAIDGLRVVLSTPNSFNGPSLASRELATALYGNSPLGRQTSVASISGITLDDIRNYYRATYHINDAIVMISGDISLNEAIAATQGQLANCLPEGPLPQVIYTPPASPPARRIILVDFPESKQSAIRIGIPGYSIASQEKFAGSLAGQILSFGTESRLGLYVRAEKGYVYGVSASFQPNRHAGAFLGSTDTKFETTAATVEAMLKVFGDMKAQPVPAKELAEAKSRIAGLLLMSMQTTRDQADRRNDGILNGYPADYYDKYAQRIGQVTADDIRILLNKYVDDRHMTVVVIAPAEKTKAQLETLGKVEVITPAAVGE